MAGDALTDFRLRRDDAENSSVYCKSKVKEKWKIGRKKILMLNTRSKKRKNKRLDRPKAKKKQSLMVALFVMDHTQQETTKRGKNCQLFTSWEWWCYAYPISVLLAKKDAFVSQIISSRAMKQTGGGGLLDHWS